MDQKSLSEAVSNMMQCLSLTPVGIPDWQSLITCLLKKSGAVYASLDSEQALPAISVDAGEQNLRETGNDINKEIVWRYESFTLRLVFADVEGRRAADTCLIMLAPHLGNLLNLAFIQHTHGVDADMARQSCAGFSIGVILINADSECVWANEQAQESLNMTRSHQGVFKLGNTISPRWLHESIQKVKVSGRPETGRYMKENLAYRCSLTRCSEASFLWPYAKELFMLVVTRNWKISEPDMLEAAYDITSAQSRVLQFTALGLSAQEVAEQTGYTKSTVYSYVKAAYKKLDVNKQAHLTAKVCMELPV